MYISKKSRWIIYNLLSDKEIDYRFNDWPITWTGLVNSKDVRIIQTQYSDNPREYKFNVEINEDEKKKLIAAIDLELRVVLD
jgi:UDP-glucose 6-dehydrogenase